MILRSSKPLKSVMLVVKYNEDHRTSVNLPMCDKCRMIEITKSELDKWFGEETK